ncbi:MAG: response regulator transcription factor [Terracidiphilus sp.]|jgi:DNA-binding NarL/FixJ family response regulator
MPIKILIVDDHPIMRFGIAAMVAKCNEMKVVGFAGNGEDAINQVARHLPNIVLLDLRLPGMSGVETLLEIGRNYPEVQVIILTAYEGDEEIHGAMEAGAKGYLTKGLPAEMLLTAIRRVHSGGMYLPAPISNTLAARTADTCLSTRECEVLELLAKGKSNKEIALDLGIQESTVKCHISVILTRLDANDRTQAVITGLERGFVHLAKPA